MVGKKIGYKRVSTAQQKHDRQLDGIALDKEYVEIASGSKTDRPKLNEMLDYVREGDIVYVHSLDRLGRDALHTINTIETILKKEASLVFVNENLTLDPNANDPMKKMLLAVFSYFAEFEKKIIAERRDEGISIAKRKGLYKGKQPRHKLEQRLEIAKKFENRDMSKFDKKAFLKEHNISATLLWRYRKEYETKQEQELLKIMGTTIQLTEISKTHIS